MDPGQRDAAEVKKSVTLDVNGKTYSLDVHPDEPLALALRNRLGLTGVKVGCSLEQCGACAVLADGESTLTCVRPAVDFEGRRIETVEGLGTLESPGPVQQALLDEGAAQCGYCTPGLVVAITALLRKEPHPEDTTIRTALAPHLCRCAVAIEVQVGDDAKVVLRRAAIAVDAGEIVDPDGLAAQLEGGFVQAASWTLLEAVSWDRDGITSRDWDSYPILRFDDIPELETVLVDRPGEPFLGAGEASCGPTGAAIANAVFDATGVRARRLPLTPQALREAAAQD